MKIEEEGRQMTVKEMIERAISNRGVMKKDVAAHMGWSKANFTNHLRNNSFDSEDLRKIAEFLGYEVRLVDSANDLMFVQEKKNGVGFPVVQVVNGKRYDTSKYDAICHTIKQGGCFYELYKDIADDEFIIVSYIENEHKANVTPVSEATARMVYESCEGAYPNMYFNERE